MKATATRPNQAPRNGTRACARALPGLGLGCVLLCCLLGCQQRLVEVELQQEAQELAVLLESRGIGVKLEQQRGNRSWAVSVGAEQLSQARAVLVEHRLPRAKPQEQASGLFGPSLADAKWRHRQEQGAQLCQSLRSLEGVIDARLHISEAPKSRGATRATLLLLVRAQEAAQIEALRERSRLLCRGAIDGLDEEALELIVEQVSATPVSPDDWAALGPWQVHRAHLGSLRLALATSLALLSASAVLIAMLVLRLRRLRRASRSVDAG